MAPVLIVVVVGMAVVGAGALVGSVYTATTVKPAYAITDAIVRAVQDPTTEWVDGILVKKAFEARIRNARSAATLRLIAPDSSRSVDTA